MEREHNGNTANASPTPPQQQQLLANTTLHYLIAIRSHLRRPYPTHTAPRYNTLTNDNNNNQNMRSTPKSTQRCILPDKSAPIKYLNKRKIKTSIKIKKEKKQQKQKQKEMQMQKQKQSYSQLTMTND